MPICHFSFGGAGGSGDLREVAARVPGANPVGDGAAFLVGESAAVHERAEIVAGEPRRHPLVGDDLGDCFRPRRGLLVRGQRERRGSALAMALPAVLGEDRRHVLGDSVTSRAFRGFGKVIRQPSTSVSGVGDDLPARTASIASLRSWLEASLRCPRRRYWSSMRPR